MLERLYEYIIPEVDARLYGNLDSFLDAIDKRDELVYEAQESFRFWLEEEGPVWLNYFDYYMEKICRVGQKLVRTLLSIFLPTPPADHTSWSALAILGMICLGVLFFIGMCILKYAVTGGPSEDDAVYSALDGNDGWD